MLKLLAEMEKLLRLEYNLCTTTATTVQQWRERKKKITEKKRKAKALKVYT
jgi:hypothetical protein